MLLNSGMFVTVLSCIAAVSRPAPIQLARQLAGDDVMTTRDEDENTAAAADVVIYQRFSIDEELPPGQIVGELGRHLPALPTTSSSDHRVLEPDDRELRRSFYFVHVDKADGVAVTEWFDLDERSGRLTTAGASGRPGQRQRRLDRDQLCRRQRTSITSSSSPCYRLSFDVVVVEPETSQLLVHVTVDVFDVNDNRPILVVVGGGEGDGNDVIEIYESAEIGTELHVGTAIDEDDPRTANGIESCELRPVVHDDDINDGSSAGHKFDLVVRRRIDDERQVDLYLVLRQELDREIDGDHQVRLAFSFAYSIST